MRERMFQWLAARGVNPDAVAEAMQKGATDLAVEVFQAHLQTLRIPPSWSDSTARLGAIPDDTRAWYDRGRGLSVMLSAAEYPDGRVWLHASMSRRSRVPTYDELTLLKRLWLPKHKAIQVFPVAEEHVNLNATVLHLWAAADGDDGLPDFTMGTGAI